MKKILLVEDSEGILFALRTFFERGDVDVIDKASVEDALGVAASETFDLIMLDYNLGRGKTKGWDLAAIVRKDPDTYGNPKIIAMSATISLTNPEDFGYTVDNFDMFIEKPFDLNDLGQRVEKLFGEAWIV